MLGGGNLTMILFEDFVLRALVAGIALAAVAGPLGCFVVWRRMAYFGDTMAHAALLGVALGLIAEIPILAAIVGVGSVIALALTALRRHGHYGADTLLGIFSHAALACGLVVLGSMETVRVDLLGYLFGDILAVSNQDALFIVGGAILALAALAVLWRPLLSMTVNPEIAAAEGVRVFRMELAFMILIAVVVAFAIKIVGILLITAMLVIPAAAARGLVRAPETMATAAAFIGAAAVVLGLSGSAYLDTPAGPSIVLATFLLFLATLGIGTLRRR